MQVLKQEILKRVTFEDFFIIYLPELEHLRLVVLLRSICLPLATWTSWTSVITASALAVVTTWTVAVLAAWTSVASWLAFSLNVSLRLLDKYPA